MRLYVPHNLLLGQLFLLLLLQVMGEFECMHSQHAHVVCCGIQIALKVVFTLVEELHDLILFDLVHLNRRLRLNQLLLVFLLLYHFACFISDRQWITAVDHFGPHLLLDGLLHRNRVTVDNGGHFELHEVDDGRPVDLPLCHLQVCLLSFRVFITLLLPLILLLFSIVEGLSVYDHTRLA